MQVNITRLKVITYTNLVLVFLYFAFFTYLKAQLASQFGFEFSLYDLANYALIACLVTHTVLVICIQRKYYPNKEIRNTSRTLVNVSAVLCVIIMILMLVAVVLLTIDLVNPREGVNRDWASLGVLIFLIIWIILMSLQIESGYRLVTCINNNYRHELVNSILINE